jgi:hypothetical protein
MSQNRELKDQIGVARGLGVRADADDFETADLVLQGLKTKAD